MRGPEVIERFTQADLKRRLKLEHLGSLQGA